MPSGFLFSGCEKMNLMDRIDDEPIASLGFMETKILKPNSSYLSFGNLRSDTNLNDHNMSDDDEPSFMEDGNNENLRRVKGRKGSSSQWQRMKWSDSRVRLLIQVVSCVDDDDGGNVEGGGGGSGRRSSCLQKKGKWKTVSKMMVSKGCEVSPQQCEDKFNDLNKRYKRLNDILGRGVSCRVVENPSLMESMPRLSAKMKEDVKKILSSKHLFYPEMCAYHNGQKIPNCESQCRSKVNANAIANANHSSDDVENIDESDDDDDDDDMDHEDDDHENDGEGERGKGNNGFRDEMNEFFEDPNNSKMQKKEWIRERMLQVHEQRIRIETEAFEMEKRRFKWQRFCDRKDRELEISKLENERLMLENERMTFQVKHPHHVIDSE